MDGPRSNPGTTAHEAPTNDPPTPTTRLHPSRRNVVLGVSVVGAAGLLSACGGGSTTATGSASASSAAPSASSSDDKGGDNSGSDDSGGSGSDDSGGEKLASKSDVPVGGGSINKDAKVVVTQPTSGTFKAFSAVCTHMNCLVTSVSKNVITCTCHGSQFSATDGSVEGGPAPSPLPSVAIKVEGDEIVKA